MSYLWMLSAISEWFCLVLHFHSEGERNLGPFMFFQEYTDSKRQNLEANMSGQFAKPYSSLLFTERVKTPLDSYRLSALLLLITSNFPKHPELKFLIFHCCRFVPLTRA